MFLQTEIRKWIYTFDCFRECQRNINDNASVAYAGSISEQFLIHIKIRSHTSNKLIAYKRLKPSRYII